MGSISKLVLPILKDKAEKNVFTMKKTCQEEIEKRMNYMKNLLLEAEKSLLHQLDEELRKVESSGNEMPEEVSFHPALVHRTSNLIGFVAVDGILPSDLSMTLLSELKDIKPGATLKLFIESESGVKDLWQSRIVITIKAFNENGMQRNLSFKREVGPGKVVFSFEAEFGAHKISVTLYGQDINQSPLTFPVQSLKQGLAAVGLAFIDKEGGCKGIQQNLEEDNKVPLEASGESSLDASDEDQEDVKSATSSVQSQWKVTDCSGHDFDIGETVLVQRSVGFLKAIVQKMLHPVRSKEITRTRERHNLSRNPQDPCLVGDSDDGALTRKWKENDKCLAQWEDGVWYNAYIKECSNQRYRVHYTDYGNEAFVSEEEIVQTSLEIPDHGSVDVFVHQVEEGPTKQAVCSEVSSSGDSSSSFEFDQDSVADKINLQQELTHQEDVKQPRVGDCCLCLKPSRRAKALICDGSIVCWGCAVQRITRDHTCWKCGKTSISTSNHLSKETVVDEKVDRPVSAVASASLSFVSLLKGDDQGLCLPVSTNLRKDKLGDEVATLELLEDGSFYCLIGTTVTRFNREGDKLCEITPNSEFLPPRNLLLRKNGEIVIIDEEGIKLYNKDLKLLRCIRPKVPLSECYGLTEDNAGHLVTVNVNRSGCGVTNKGSSSIFIIDLKTEHIFRIIDLGELIDETQQAMSRCEFIAFKNDVFYVADIGLNSVYVIQGYGESASMFGRTGRGELEFRGLNSVVVDSVGNMIVADGLNYRLQVVSKENEFLGFVKVDNKLSRPRLLCVDEERNEVYVFNKWTRSINRYKL